AASPRQALHDLFHAPGIERAHGDVVEEEERRRAVHEDVVAAVAHEVLVDRVVAAAEDGHLELGAHAVHAGGKELPRRAGNPVRAREAPEIGGHVRVERGAAELADPVHRLLALPDVHARVLVAGHGTISRRRSASPGVSERSPEAWSCASATTARGSNCDPAWRWSSARARATG